ncbi:DUF6126 family protein [Streptomyces sp. NPDC091292]|uniref:DUF6126 family protein n=1 Tax=Streptomyces sp. NPDC091292 TaxID=3365991 RepID=UPI00380A9E81
MTEAPRSPEPTQPTEPIAPPTPSRRDMEEKLPRGLWVRLLVYVAVGHLLAAFIFLLFEIGAQNQ